MKVKVAFILRLNYEELKNSSHDEEAKLPQKVGGILPISWCKRIALPDFSHLFLI
ncbi:MAG: hypothetical protein V5A76_03740 [Candidatus Thermoplasmatota archaeon]